MKSPAMGDIGKDTLTGFEGRIVAHSRWLHNCDRWTLLPPKTPPGKEPETQAFDAPRVAYVRAGDVAPEPIVRKSDVDLGDAVHDTLTGVDGTALAIRTDINGCVTVGVQPKGLHEGKPGAMQWSDDRNMKVVKKRAVVAPPVTTGGPRPEPRRFSGD